LVFEGWAEPLDQPISSLNHTRRVANRLPPGRSRRPVLTFRVRAGYPTRLLIFVFRAISNCNLIAEDLQSSGNTPDRVGRDIERKNEIETQ
jgi:hypothetical protein